MAGCFIMLAFNLGTQSKRDGHLSILIEVMERHRRTTSYYISAEVPEYQTASLPAISPLSMAVEEHREPDRHNIFR